MKKIALFSCHNDPNYGSMLQAYALAAAIEKYGQKAEYITYSTAPDPNTFKSIARRVITWPIKALRNVFRPIAQTGEFAFFKTPEFADTMNAYERFHKKYIPTSIKCYYSDTIRKKLDVQTYCNYIVGSDQSWSPNLYRKDKPYMLDFADLPKRCSYAPSLGTTDISNQYLELLKSKLICFDHLSCREAANSKLLTKALGREVTHVLDPTLLLTRDDWDRVAKTPSIKGDYILAYILGEKDAISDFAQKLGREKDLPVYYIVTRPKYLSYPNALNGVGPDDWVGLIRGARYVVTDSYHGCLFSINYNVDFYAFSKREGGLNSKDNARILEFLTIAGLQKRFQDDKRNPQIIEDIEYSSVNNVISALRTVSHDYLAKCIFE